MTLKKQYRVFFVWNSMYNQCTNKRI